MRNIISLIAGSILLFWTSFAQAEGFKFGVGFMAGQLNADGTETEGTAADTSDRSKSFDELLQYEIIFPVDDYIDTIQKNNQRYLPFTRQNQEFLLGQYAFASVPNHPFLLELIESIHKNINMYVKYVNANTDDYVYQTTGPDFVTQKYIDTKKKDIKILHAKRQYFGNYARHLYMGSWK